MVGRLEARISRSQPDLQPWFPLIAIAVDLQVPPTTEVSESRPRLGASKLREVVLQFLRRALVSPAVVEVEHAHLMDAASAALFERSPPSLTRRRGSCWSPAATSGRPAAARLASHPDRAHSLVAGRRTCTGAFHPRGQRGAAVRPGARRRPLRRQPRVPARPPAAAAAGDREELPESVGAATMARIDALDPSDGAIVRRAAVLGVNFHPRRLADVLEAGTSLPEDGFWDRLSEVFAREPDGHVRFRRPALQRWRTRTFHSSSDVNCIWRWACGSSATRPGAGRRAGDPLAPLLPCRGLHQGPPVRDGGGQARHRCVLPRRRRPPVSKGDRAGAGGGRGRGSGARRGLGAVRRGAAMVRRAAAAARR